jgi:hypothetical protein
MEVLRQSSDDLPLKTAQVARALKSPDAYSIREALDDGRPEEKSRVVFGNRHNTGIGND